MLSTRVSLKDLILPVPAVPLSVAVSDGRHAGSGFFASYAGREWLITAGHLPLMISRPHCRWNEWPNAIQIERGVAASPTKQLFRSIGGRLDPAFAYLGGGDEPLSDFMALPTELGTAHQLDAELFDLETAPMVDAGSKATVLGYPTTAGVWPQAHPKAFSVAVTDVGAESFMYESAAPRGTSGGPVVGADGRLLGMTIGFDDVGKAVTAFAMREILKANLAAARF